MVKVYVLMGGCIGDSYVVGVFFSMKKANEAREWIISVDTSYNKHPEDLYVDVFEMNGERIDK